MYECLFMTWNRQPRETGHCHKESKLVYVWSNNTHKKTVSDALFFSFFLFSFDWELYRKAFSFLSRLFQCVCLCAWRMVRHAADGYLQITSCIELVNSVVLFCFEMGYREFGWWYFVMIFWMVKFQFLTTGIIFIFLRVLSGACSFYCLFSLAFFRIFLRATAVYRQYFLFPLVAKRKMYFLGGGSSWLFL